MSYLNFYIDPISGTDSNPSSLTNATASNPSGTITRINFTGHGLTTGQAVFLSSFSTWLNTWWRVTVVDANNFDLDDAVWQTTADATGNVARYNGYSWATAYKNVNFISSNAFNKTTDILVAKSPAPTSIGNATWTNATNTTGFITLATAQTLNIDNCETAWTAANGATVTRTTVSPVKQGTYMAQIVTPAATAVSTKYAYYTLPATLDLSAYQKISFWVMNITSAIADANRYVIKLCSDTTGDVAVDEFSIPAIAVTSQTNPFTIAKTGGGNLGNSIKSIALYTGTSSPGNTQTIRFDNFTACTTDGLCLNSVLSKCNVATYDHTQDMWYGIDNIEGTTVNLTSSRQQGWTSNRLCKYFTKGTSPETVTTYMINPISLPQNSVTNKIINIGNYTALVQILGGYNTTNTTQDGMTWFDGIYGYGRGITGNGTSTTNGGKNFIVSNFGFARFDYTFMAMNSNGVMSDGTISNIYSVNPNTFINSDISTHERMTYTNISGNTDTSFQISGSHLNIENLKVHGTQGERYFNTGTSKIVSVELLNNVSETRIMCNKFSLLKDWYIDPNSPNLSGNTQRAIYASNGSANTLYNSTIKGARNALAADYGGELNFINGTLLGNTNTVGYSVGNVNVINPMTRTDTNYANFNGAASGIQDTLATFTGVGGDTNNNRIYYQLTNNVEGAQVLSQTSVRKSATGIAWQINILSTRLTETYPFALKIATVAVNANALVTVKAWVKKSHATDIGAKLMIYSGSIAGITSDVTATKSNDTNWEELTITFTPTIKGAVDIYILSYWQANLADESIYVDDMTITQA